MTEPAPQPRPPRRPRRWLPTRLQALLAFAAALVLLLLNDTFLLESIVVPSGSMTPTILPNERLWMWHRHGGTFQRFDVVVIAQPSAARRIVKRIIGLPGERIRLQDGWRVAINDTPFKYAAGPTADTQTEAADHVIQLVPPGAAQAAQDRVAAAAGTVQHITLGPDEYYVLGDNRLASEDSRVIGPVRGSQIEGMALMAWYSFDPGEHRVRWDRLLKKVR